MDEARYTIALRIAKAGLRRLGCRSVDGREAHDLAMQSLHLERWSTRVVWFDVLDAYRRERGARGRRMVGIPRNLEARTVEPFELSLDLKDRTEVLVCELLAAGYLKQEVAAVVGVTPARIGQICEKIRRRHGELVQGPGGGERRAQEPPERRD